jgi:hypothetical protein
MSLQSKRELLEALRDPYESASHSGRKRLLDGFQAATGYSRKHAIKLMRGTVNAEKKRRGPRATPYDQELKAALSTVWQAAGCICSKRLIPFLPELIPALERCKHITLEPGTRENLLRISAATADRMLKSERQRLGRSVGMTQRGSLLRRQIAVRTSAQWDDVVPGFFEADLVAHNGGNQHGQFIYTLTMTDIASGWTECAPLLRKTDDAVVAAIKKVQNRLPIPLLGIDTDNGSEFINHTLSDYCKAQSLVFTRSRVFKSNDQAHVEQKNGAVVRRLVGYKRFEGDQMHKCMNDLYKLTRLYVNFFQPSCKLKSKVRDGGHVTKRYDKAQTPCQRLIHLVTSETIKLQLHQTFMSLNPVQLLADIESLQLRLDAATKEMLNIPESTEVLESEKLMIRAKSKTEKKMEQPSKVKTGRKSIVPDEVTRVISFLMHQDPSMTSTGLLPLLNQRYPGMYGNKQWATLARQIKKWRALHPEYQRFYPKCQRKYADRKTTANIA